MSRRIRTIYTAKQKQSAIDACFKHGIKKTSIKKDIPLGTLNKWIREHRDGVVMTKTGAGKKTNE